MTTFDEVLIYIAQLSAGLLIIICVLYVLEAIVEAVQSKILIHQLKRTPYILNNTEKMK